jgi:hypothetical protein
VQRAVAVTALAVLLQFQPAQAGQLSTFEGDVDSAHTFNPANGRYDEQTAYKWGDSFDANLVDHLSSNIGVTDGSGSMNVHDPNGGFSWGTQILFNNFDDPNNPASANGMARYADLTTSTKMLLDITTPGGDTTLPGYEVGFGALNYGFSSDPPFAGYFLDSYNPSGGGNYYQFASGPASQTAYTTQTYTWDFGKEFSSNGVPLWDHLSGYVLIHFNTNSPGGQVADYYYDNFRVVNEDPNRSTWAAAGTGNWTDAGSWAHGVPNAVGAPAIFYGAGNGSVTLNSAVTVGSIIFDAAVTSYSSNGVPPPNIPVVSYTISGTGSLTFAVASGKSEIYVIAGNTAINVPVAFNADTDIDMSAGFGPDNNASLPGGGRFSQAPVTSLTFGAPVTIAGGTTLKTRGVGTVEFNGGVNGGSAALTINGGRTNFGGNVNVSTFTIASSARATVAAGGGKVLRTQTLNLAGSADLNDNAMIVDYGTTSPLPAVQSAITSAYAGGAWTGPGLTSSTAAAAASSAHKTALGYAEASAVLGPSGGTFAGQSVDATAVLVRYTYSGDANLDGKVDTLDFNSLAANFGGTSKVWSQADFNYDGKVDTLDFNNLAANFGQQIASATGGGAGALVPEPSSALLVVPAAAVACVRRLRLRRRRSEGSA